MENDTSEQGGEPANLRFLRRMVTVLTATMILGLLTIVTLLVIRVMSPGQVALPDEITLPQGARAAAFTRGPDWFAVVTDNDQILIFDARTGELRKTVPVHGE